MKIKILLLAFLFIGCQKESLEVRPFEMGSINFELQAPKLTKAATSKVPSCKGIEPINIAFNLTNKRGEVFSYANPIELVNGRYISNSTGPNTLSFGNYTINDISLVNGNDTIYSVPKKYELELSPYWDISLPMEISVTGSEVVSGKVFCFDQSESPDITGIINGGFDPVRIQSLWFAVFNEECITQITIEVDYYRFPEIFLWDELLYHVAVPMDYNVLTVRAYSGNSLVQSFSFDSENPYNEDGNISEDDVVVFDYDCI